MARRDTPIKRKLLAINLLTGIVVSLVTCAAFFAYDFLTFRQNNIRHVATLGEIIAANSTAALAFENSDDAAENLRALRAERRIVAACLYDMNGRLFSKYPATLPNSAFPARPGADGYKFTRTGLSAFQPVVQNGRRLGTLYLESDMGALQQRFRLDGGVMLLAIAGSFLLAYLLSGRLQKQITGPILALAEVAQAVSDRRDYSVRAPQTGRAELGLLTDTFNQMLVQIHNQDRALRESEERLRAVLNSALSAVVVIDAKGFVVDWNAPAEKMFGWTRQEALGRELAETIVPIQYRTAHRRGMQHFLATGEGPVLNRLLELTSLRRDGSEFPAELSVSPLKTGDVVTFCGFITDITERKQAQSRLQEQLSRLSLLNQITRGIGERQDLQSIFQVILRSLEDNLPIHFGCVCLYDAGAQILTVNSVGPRSQALTLKPALADKTQISIDENGLSRCVRGELVYEPDITRAPFAFPQQLTSGGLASLVAAPLVVEGKVFGVLVVARNVVDAFSSAECEFLLQLSEHTALAAHQARLYTALQEAYDDLRQSQQSVMQQERLRALGQMASGIAHDINNAISPVTLYTESLLEKDTGLSDRARDYLRTIQRAVDDVAQTVSRMREFYRAREPQLVLAPVDLNVLVRQVLDLTRARWYNLPQEQGIVIDLQTELASDLPRVMGAEAEIRDALTNLIFNAVDAMPKGGTLTLRTRCLLAEDATPGTAPLVCLEVADTGVGMEEETKRRCLEPFFTTKGERGTGLGLAMVYGMVQRHSAEIEIDSAPGQGTTVRLTFLASTPTLVSTVRPAAPLLPTERQRILIVDDDPLLIRSLQDILEGDGHEVMPTDGGQTAIDAFAAAQKRGEPYGVVITDLGMPYIDGRKVAAAIKEMSPGTPIIMLTGWGQRMIAENDIPEHVDRVLNKPPKLHELRLALAELTAK